LFFLHASSLRELLSSALCGQQWLQAFRSDTLRNYREVLAKFCCLPSSLRECHDNQPRLRAAQGWLEFCGRQLRLQSLLAGKYMGTVTPENCSGNDEFEVDWEVSLEACAELRPLTLQRLGHVTRRYVAAGAQETFWEMDYQWLVVDRRIGLDRQLWDMIKADVSFEAPDARWEDGDLHCGVRGVADFRPAVDPSFLELSDLVVVLCPAPWCLPPESSRLTCWAVNLFAPCAWMLSKGSSWLEQLDHQAAFRHESAAAALAASLGKASKRSGARLWQRHDEVLGRQLERAVIFSGLEKLAEVTKSAQLMAATPAAGSRRRKGAAKAKKWAEPRDLLSGRNPNGLNLYIPRRKLSDVDKSLLGAAKAAAKPKVPFLGCNIRVGQDLCSFLRLHRPSARAAEQLCVRREDLPLGGDVEGLIEDACRLERSGSLSQASVVQLARKWQVLTGKWLLFVPEWRVDDLFESAATRLKDGDLPSCSHIVVSPPGAYGTDPTKYMFSAHTPDFTDAQSVMALGKSLRAAARSGLRSPAGDWGELRDDPFAAPGKKASLVFKPDVFTRLNLHKKNAYGIKTTLHVLDL
ncbi:unnamed protein product, partial [Symbiodinium microadriaticum]